MPNILMPALSPTMEEGKLAKWLKKVGDNIKSGDVLAEIETDKATMEVEASDDGILHKIIGVEGNDIQVGVPIAVLRGAKETVAADYVPKGKEGGAQGQSHEVKVMAEVVQPTPVVTPLALSTPALSTGRVKASPLAKRLAGQQGINLSSVQGSGPHGRIVAADLAGAACGSRAVVRKADSVEKLSPMRKAIAARLTASKQTVPHFYLNASVRMDALLEVRKQLNAHLESQKIKLSVNDFILKACGLALRDYPAANASWNTDSVVQYGNVDISVAVSIEGGLITPIVQNADQKSLQSISAEVKKLAADARAGALKPEQYTGGSFSVSNLGMYGVESFSAIINPPQACILAVGTTVETIVAEHGQPKVANVMSITLSVDHRVVDGALGAELLARVKYYLEQPAVMLVSS